MSFSSEVKQELVSLRIEKSCCMLSELNALTQSCASMTLHGRGQVSIAFSSENVTVAKRVFILLKKRLEINATPHFNKVERFGGRRVCVIRLSQGDTRKLMLSLHMLHESEQGEVYRGLPRRALTRKCCQHAFLRGAFLGEGSVTAPEHGYHLEFVCNSEPRAQALSQLLTRCELDCAIIQRRGAHIVYLKRSGQISTLLGLIGATRAMMHYENILAQRSLHESVLRGSADAALAAVPEGANAVALRVKNAQGELLYDSALQEAIDVNAVKGGSGANAVIEALTGSEVYTIARINATHDSLYSFAHMADAGVLQLNYAGYIWYDPDSTFYLAPEKPAARQYIVSVARECAELGFDELLFDEFGYPTRGRLNNIDESARTLSKSAALAQLAEELRSGTEAYGVRLSVQLDAATVLAGGNEAAGQDLAALAAVFDRIYVETTAEQLPALTAALEPYDAELVPILSEAPASGSYLLTA